MFMYPLDTPLRTQKLSAPTGQLDPRARGPAMSRPSGSGERWWGRLGVVRAVD
jgi:hypothetical protein